MLGRKKDEAPATTPEPEANGSHVVRPGAKNRPTPKRRDQEAARKHLVVDPDRKRASMRDRVGTREEAKARQAAAMRGEEWALFERDRGAYRAFARDWVDARWNVGEAVMPLMLVAVIVSVLAQWVKSEALLWTLMLLTYGTFFAAIIDAVITSRKIKRVFRERHPREEIPSGSGMYAGMRMLQIRPTRTPRPRVARGEFPA